MNHAKSGITIIEVVVAVLMLAAAGTTLMGLQGTLLRGISESHGFLERLGFIRSFFVVTHKNQQFKRAEQTATLEDPSLRYTYQLAPTTSPSLSSQKQVEVQRVEAEWLDPFGTRVERFARLQFTPRKELAA